MVHSTRGRQGGYSLAVPPENITVAAIVRAVDGPLAPLPCASVRFYRRCSDCKDEKTCEVRKIMREVRDAASAILDNMTLAEVAGQPAKRTQVKRARQRA
jgi:Rrf2 family protein